MESDLIFTSRIFYLLTIPKQIIKIIKIIIKIILKNVKAKLSRLIPHVTSSHRRVMVPMKEV